MVRLMSRLIWLLPGVVFVGLVGGVSAGDHDTAHRLREGGVILPLQRLIAGDAALAGARILEVDLERKDGRYLYEIEYLDGDGHVWEGRFDAATGERLQTKRED